MYTRKEVAAGKFAIRCATVKEAKTIVAMFPDRFEQPDKWIGYFGTYPKMCYSPNDVFGGPSYGSYESYQDQGHVMVSLQDISDLSEQSGEGVREKSEKIKAMPEHIKAKLTEKAKKFGGQTEYVMAFGDGAATMYDLLTPDTPTPIGRDIEQHIKEAPFQWFVTNIGRYCSEETIKMIVDYFTPSPVSEVSWEEVVNSCPMMTDLLEHIQSNYTLTKKK